MIETQAWRQHGAVGKLHVVFRKQRENFRVGIRVAMGTAHPWNRAAFSERLGIRGAVFHPLLGPFRTQRQRLVNPHIQRQVDFAVQGDIA